MEDLGELLGGEDLRLHIRCANLVESLRLGRIASETGPAVSTPSGNERLCKVFTYDAAHRITQTQYRKNSPAGTLLATESKLDPENRASG
jgi:hypothetical protein